MFLIEQFRVCPRSQCVSTVAIRTDLFPRNPEKVLLTDFFGSVRNIELVTDYVSVQNITTDDSCRYVLHQ